MDWVYCPNPECNSKLMREDMVEGRVEVPCSSCGKIIIVEAKKVTRIDTKVSES